MSGSGGNLRGSVAIGGADVERAAVGELAVAGWLYEYVPITVAASAVCMTEIPRLRKRRRMGLLGPTTGP
jgi:hypothetical protein